MPKINRYWNSDPNSLVEREPPQTYDLCKCCELVNQLVWKEKRLKRALWIARAERAKEFRYKIKFAICSMNTKYDYSDAEKWEKVERKCRAKAEEYK